MSLRKISKRLLVFLNVLFALALITTCLQRWLDPVTFWFLGFFSLAFPYIFIILIVYVFFWLAAKVPYALISIIAIGIAWREVDVLLNIKQQSFTLNKAPGNLRVMSWNVKSLTGMEEGQKVQDRNAEKILKLIEEISPDLLCLQEFGHFDSPGPQQNYIRRLKEQGFKHHILSKDYIRVKMGYSNGLAIFSKLPLLNQAKVPYKSSPESILYVDVVFNGDTIRLVTTHLQSFKFTGTDYRDLQRIKNTEDSLYEASLNIYTKMKRAYRNRAGQANQVQPLLDESPYPELVACDMNDVPTSYAYWQLKGNRQDAFSRKGFGIGRTFIALAPTLRIDYILADRQFVVKQFETIQKRYSDHFPIVSDLQLTTPEP